MTKWISGLWLYKMRIKSRGLVSYRLFLCAVYFRGDMSQKVASVFLEQDLCQYNHDWNKGEHPNWNCKSTIEEEKISLRQFLSLIQTNDECFHKADLPGKRRVMTTFSFVPDNIKKESCLNVLPSRPTQLTLWSWLSPSQANSQFQFSPPQVLFFSRRRCAWPGQNGGRTCAKSYS